MRFDDASTYDLDLGAVIVGGQLFDQRVFGGDHHERGPPQGVGPGGEHPQRFTLGGAVGHHEVDERTFGTADPVGLHRLDRLGPVDVVIRQQFVGVVGDGEEPLAHHLLDDRLTQPFVFAVDHLLVGQHGVESRGPIDHGLAPVRDARFVHLLEDVFGPHVVVGFAADHLAIPVEHGAHGA